MTRHPLLAVLLAFVLAAGTILSGPAMARHAGTPVTLCSDGGLVTITLDAQGHPVSPHRPCPLCLAAQDWGPPPAPAGWSRPDAAAQPAAPLPPVLHAQGRRPTLASARGPPLPV
jgi:hypothetical protein